MVEIYLFKHLLSALLTYVANSLRDRVKMWQKDLDGKAVDSRSFDIFISLF